MAVLSDIGLLAKVKADLSTEVGLETAHIDVDTADGVVILRGTVPYPGLREMAEGMALRQGAREVVNRLVVEHPDEAPTSAIIPEEFPGVTTPPGAPPSEHAPAEEAVREALAADPRVNEHLIRVQVTEGIAYLSGRQDTVDARDAATETAAHVPGVLGVENDLEVLPSV